MTFEDCESKGLIRKSENAKDRVKQSLALGSKFLKSAQKNFQMDENEICEIIAYNALFHYARALLFNKGYIERSHSCLFIALKRLYPQLGEAINEADRIRVERHNLQYDGFASDAKSALYVLEFVRKFGKTSEELLGRQK
ncbi:DNA-binding protein [Candidatus Micrarchaeota archaeon CG11_big_fil_rev_8_21_14_0_20_47_5]|nr:MAG: hypothetical protein AUJ17_00535 [Candidatus Micrarchaeota archaeon CG1_02_47_40]PIN82579.1 MAG: DNA-binding protein [Candidatus Micrarchaeota archaeon CG11_big_fil_rev_8_21_14_0_20_47_5]